ncbi:MAG: hypothetical protein AAB540_00695 [Patescibacteria group bacterium]
MGTAEGQETAPVTALTGAPQTDLSQPQETSDTSVAHRMPKDICSDRCQASAVTFEDDTDATKEWITCELSLALAQGNLTEILEIRKRIMTAQNGTGEENSPRCPILAYADNLVASVSAKIAQAISSGQVPEAFRATEVR